MKWLLDKGWAGVIALAVIMPEKLAKFFAKINTIMVMGHYLHGIVIAVKVNGKVAAVGRVLINTQHWLTLSSMFTRRHDGTVYERKVLCSFSRNRIDSFEQMTEPIAPLLVPLEDLSAGAEDPVPDPEEKDAEDEEDDGGD